MAHGFPVEAAFQHHRAAGIAGALIGVFELALDARELIVGQARRAVGAAIDQRAGGSRRIVEQRLDPGGAGVVDVDRIGGGAEAAPSRNDRRADGTASCAAPGGNRSRRRGRCAWCGRRPYSHRRRASRAGRARSRRGRDAACRGRGPRPRRWRLPYRRCRRIAGRRTQRAKNWLPSSSGLGRSSRLSSGWASSSAAPS